MSTYAQWARTRQLRRFAYVCGDEPVLRQEVLEEASHHVGWHGVLYMDEISDGQMWDTLFQGLIQDQQHLYLVKFAERIRDWSLLQALINSSPSTWVWFESAEEDFPKADGKLAGHLAPFRDSRAGMLVRCIAPAGDALVDWADRRLGHGRAAAARVLEVTGSLSAAADVISKIRHTEVPASEQMIRYYAADREGAPFVTALLFGSRAEAMAAAGECAHGEVGAAIGLLTSRLETLERLYQGVNGGMKMSEIRSKLGLKEPALSSNLPIAGGYPPDRVLECRYLLLAADSAWRMGQDTGVLEMVAACW